MVFSSLVFLYAFLPICLIVYFLCPNLKAKNLSLTLFSLFFYAWGEPVWVVLLIFSSVVDFVNGKIVGRYRGQWPAKFALISSLVINLGLLGVFKYAGFFVDNINGLLGTSIAAPSLSMPIGISFYTFQTLSYTIDVYRDEVKVQHNFMDFLLFVSLFPQLIAGPILRYSDLAEQLDNRKTTLRGAFYGVMRFCGGLGKKVLIANYVGAVANNLLGGSLSTMTTGDAWLGVLMYSFQIYFDFSGYSDMAIGLGRIFGFHYPENFNLPYLAGSITDFWRRWHISLSSFFRDYVYIPMGGNRVSRGKHIRNILVVWFLTGFWHGASWNFIFWGMFYGLLLMLEKYVPQVQRIPRPLRHVLTLILVMFGWTLFYFTDLGRLGICLKAMLGFSGHGIVSVSTKTYFVNNLPLILLAALGCTGIPRTIHRIFARLCGSGRSRRYPRRERLYAVVMFVLSFAVLLLSTASLVGSSYNPFLYFRF